QDTSRLISATDEVPSALPGPAIDSVANSEEDIPVAPEYSSSEAKPSTTVDVRSGRIIQIKTDVLQLAVDLQGGDIMELSLPKFLAELDDPNDPFVLLEDNAALTYIAQSGLIGPD
ncbi:MAG: membrane protein insertase YidC, partial [Halioglobus sp.]